MSGYADAALKRWASRIRDWSEGREPKDAQRVCNPAPRSPGSRDVYCYFDNDAKVHAPFDAGTLMSRLEVRWLPRERRPLAGPLRSGVS